MFFVAHLYTLTPDVFDSEGIQSLYKHSLSFLEAFTNVFQILLFIYKYDELNAMICDMVYWKSKKLSQVIWWMTCLILKL